MVALHILTALSELRLVRGDEQGDHQLSALTCALIAKKAIVDLQYPSFSFRATQIQSYILFLALSGLIMASRPLLFIMYSTHHCQTPFLCQNIIHLHAFEYLIAN